MKKKLNETAIVNELREGSSFFQRSRPQHAPPSPARPDDQVPAAPPSRQASTTARAREPMSSRYPDERIDAIRKAVKAVGREDSTIRLTREEKLELRDIAYTFERQGHPISEGVRKS